ncbi:MAG: hypothetical protein AB7D07_10395 [Desulfovibrionaceae bacterium]
MRRYITLLTEGLDAVPSKKQMAQLKKLGVRLPTILTRQRAEELLEREIALRDLQDLQRAMEEKRQKRELSEHLSSMRKAYLEQEAAKHREAVSKSTELATIDEEELARLRRKYGTDRRIGRGR